MENQIKISVIVPIYGVEKYIGRCVRSLMEQTLSDIEYIFVNDCTPDKSISIAKEVIDQYPARKSFVKWVHHSHNKGISATRNSGLAIAQGEYIYYCDSDDYLDVLMLEKLYVKAKADNLDFVWCDFYLDTMSGVFFEKVADFDPSHISMLKKYLTYGWNVVWNTICKKDVYTKNGIKSLEKISFCEDFELMSRLLICCESWGKVEEPLYYYNRKNTSSIIGKSLSYKKLEKTIDDAIAAVYSVYLFIMNFNLELFDHLKTELNWRMLKAKTYLYFFPSKRLYYLSVMPESNKDIKSNPLCTRFQKYMQQLILSPITAPIVWLLGFVFKCRIALK